MLSQTLPEIEMITSFLIRCFFCTILLGNWVRAQGYFSYSEDLVASPSGIEIDGQHRSPREQRKRRPM